MQLINHALFTVFSAEAYRWERAALAALRACVAALRSIDHSAPRSLARSLMNMCNTYYFAKPDRKAYVVVGPRRGSSVRHTRIERTRA